MIDYEKIKKHVETGKWQGQFCDECPAREQMSAKRCSIKGGREAACGYSTRPRVIRILKEWLGEHDPECNGELVSKQFLDPQAMGWKYIGPEAEQAPHQPPPWDTAPEWAEWLAMDENGAWNWYKEKPYQHAGERQWYRNQGDPFRACVLPNWRTTLQQRPKGAKDE